MGDGWFGGKLKKKSIWKASSFKFRPEKKEHILKNPVLIANFFLMNRAQSLYRVIVWKKILHLCM